MNRKMAARLAASIVLVGCSAPLTAGELDSARTVPVASITVVRPGPSMAPSLVPDWPDRFDAALAALEYHATEQRNGLQAPNRAHNLRTFFDPTGIRVHDRTAVGSPTLASLSLAGLGRDGELTAMPPGAVTASDARIEIRRAGLTEWYANSAQGLEQGFTLETQPPGHGPLVLELGVERATAALHGDSIVLTTGTGRKLAYGELVAVDARGTTLASRLEVASPQRVRLVVEDADAAYPIVIDPLLTAIADVRLESNQLGTSGIKPPAFGRSIASAGDVNGDGFDDVIVGAWGWDGGDNEEGAAFVFLGSANGIVGTDPATAFARIESNNAAARFGWSVAAAGDVNGDGFDDLLIGAYLYRSTVVFEDFGPGTVQGAAFVYLGGPTAIQGASDPAQANARIISNEIDSFLGYSVAGAGDINGDGFADIIVGAPRAGIPFPPNIPPWDRQGNGGAALVFLGGPGGITGTGFADADKELRPYPPGQPALVGGELGISVAGAGNVNGDLFADIVVGMTGEGGAALVFLGSANGLVGDDPSTAHARIASDSTTPLGDHVAGAGDVNGDGFDDIVLGAPRAPIPPLGFSPENLGAVLVFHGSAQGITATSAANAQTKIDGVVFLAGLGWDVDAAGDVDNDGFDDIIAGALNYAGSLNQEGAGYVFRGGPLGITAASLRDDAYVRLEARQSGAALNLVDAALSVAGLGDVNGDGFADVALGAGFYDAGQINEGAAFIYYGGPAPAQLNRPPVADAGPDQVYVDIDNDFAATITVDGSGSFDLGGSIVGYEWYEGEDLLGTSPVLITALPPTGDHMLVLVVTDDGGLRRGDPVTIRVVPPPASQLISSDDFGSGGPSGGVGWTGPWTPSGTVAFPSVDSFPSPPHARLGPGASSLSRSASLPGSTGLSIKFQGKTTGFAAGDTLRVQVSIDGGAFTTVHTIDASTVSWVSYGVTPPSPGPSVPITHSWYPATASSVVLRFELSSANGSFLVDDASIRAWTVPPGTPVPPANQLPAANAGGDLVVDDNDVDGVEPVLLDGTGSIDPDGVVTSYEWFEVTSGGTLPLGTDPIQAATFGHGVHTVRLIVTDNLGGSMADEATVTVNEVFPNNQLPVADAGADQTVVDVDGNTLEVVTFDGTGSFDPDGTIVSYIWRKNGNLFGNTATFSVTQPIGEHTVELTVTDDLGATSTDTVVVNIVPNEPIPTIETFSATETTIDEGAFTNLVWSISGAVSATIDNGVGAIGASGSVLVGPTSTTTYTLTATGAGGGATASVTITVNAAPAPSPTVDSFSATPTTVTAGDAVTLSWTTTDADSVAIDNGGGTGLAADGSVALSPSATTTYVLTATGPGGTASASVTVTVDATPRETLSITQLTYRSGRREWRIAGTSSIPGPGNAMTIFVGPTVAGSPVLGTASVDTLGSWSFRQRNSPIPPHSSGMISIQSSQGNTWEGISGTGIVPDTDPQPVGIGSFTASPATITAGSTATLAWTTSNATSVALDNGIGSVPASGSAVVSPSVTTTYTLTAQGTDGPVSAQATVTVETGGTPQGSVTLSGPATLNRGDNVSYTVMLTNTGSSTISAAQLGFSVSPGSLFKDLSPGSSVTVGDLAPGASVSRTWSARGDNEGSGTLTVSATSGGASLGSVTRTVTVLK